MTNQQVRNSVRRTLNRCGEVLFAKGKEYAGGDEDRLKNFKEGAQLFRSNNSKTDPKQVLWGYLLKHLTSIHYMVSMKEPRPSMAQWDEKVGDAINYLLLLKALVDEEVDQLSVKAYRRITTRKKKDEIAYVEELLFGGETKSEIRQDIQQESNTD